MKYLHTPRQLPVHVPETDAEDETVKFDVADQSAIKAYYQENGYVVVRACVDPSLCDSVRRLWDTEVKPFDGYMYRQASAKVEKHVLNQQGWVMNPILNLQSVDPAYFPKFREFAVGKVFSVGSLTNTFRTLLGGKPKIVQSMYFEGNSATWEHQDTYYLDSEYVGTMAAAWIAIEDIGAEAGRFFICPKSHKIDLIWQSAENNIADSHDAYVMQVVNRMRELNLTIKAPFLKKGDVLFWNACTIHGSLDSQDPVRSRSSITCHAIADQHRFMQMHSRLFDLKTEALDGATVFRPKDLAKARNRIVMAIEANFPKAFYGLKKAAMRRMIARSAAVERPSNLKPSV